MFVDNEFHMLIFIRYLFVEFSAFFGIIVGHKRLAASVIYHNSTHSLTSHLTQPNYANAETRKRWWEVQTNSDSLCRKTRSNVLTGLLTLIQKWLYKLIAQYNMRYICFVNMQKYDNTSSNYLLMTISHWIEIKPQFHYKKREDYYNYNCFLIEFY